MTTLTSAKLVLPVSERDHIRGSANAPVTLVEYGDFECPYCGAAYGILEELRQRVGELFRLVYRHFPLTQIHPHAEPAAETAEAAGVKGRFWSMHDILFTHQQAVELPRLIEYGTQLGLDAAWLVEVLRARSFLERIREDFVSGVRSGVSGTPTFFLEGLRYEQPVNLPSLEHAIQETAKRKLGATAS
ncbi:MAG: oxidoreductase [Bryobacterales bacterium]|nr:oxidoreductase [Bryobacterales bacterium]